MHRHTTLLGLLFVGAFCLLAPGEAHAQGGRWDWIQRMSGPGYEAYKTIGVGFGYCLNATPEIEIQITKVDDRVVAVEFVRSEKSTRCLVVGANNFLPGLAPSPDQNAPSHEPQFTLDADFIDRAGGPVPQATIAGQEVITTVVPGERPTYEWLVGFGVSGGWDGTNDDNGIADVKMLVLEPSLQVMRTGWGLGGPYTGVGLGVHRFWGGTAPEPFWNTAMVFTGGYRFELLESEKLLLNVGLKVRYFFDRMDSDMFGGAPGPEDGTGGGEWVLGMVFGVGWRFSLLTG